MDPLGVSLAVGAVVAAILGYFLGRNRERARQLEEKEAARDEASLIRKRAEQDADNVRLAAELQAKEDVYRLRETWESEESRRREDVERGERRLLNRTEAVDRKSDLLDGRTDALEEREAGLKRKESEVAGRGAEVERTLAETRTRLEALAGVTADEARSELVAEIKDEARAEAANRVREIRDEAQRTADREAKRLVAMAIQRMAADETAQQETVAKSEKEVEVEMREAAEEVLYGLGIHSVHPEIVKVLGRLKFRTSYGQNQLAHAREVALLAGNMAAEMGLDVQAARRAGLLHDVGKGQTHEQELTHVELGYRLCKRFKEPDIVLNAIKAHHDEEPHRYAEAWLVTAADAISGARPGARREMFEGYVKRLEKLEEIATEHPGVERCFAIQAGRELRVMVEPEKVSDEAMARISEAVARKIEGELQYPGQIKVVVIRETRAIDFAR